MESVAGARSFTTYAARPWSLSNGGSMKPVSVFPNHIHIKALETRDSRLSISSTSVDNGAISNHIPIQGNVSLRGDDTREYNVQQSKRNAECLFRYDKAVPEQLIDKPIGLSLSERKIGNNPRCIRCEAKGVVLCPSCTGSGLYVDSILESQGIIVKVRCLGCGGNGNIMCSNCGGRGHL